MSTIPADRLIELRDRLQAAQDILGRAAVILASMVPKPTPSKPISEIAVEIPDSLRSQLLSAVARCTNAAEAVRAALDRRENGRAA
jgi:hypothetical protein